MCIIQGVKLFTIIILGRMDESEMEGREETTAAIFAWLGKLIIQIDLF